MATGTTGAPWNLPFPVGSDQYALANDLASMASQTSLALNNAKNEAIDEAQWTGAVITAGTDMNTLTTPRSYRVLSYAVAESLLNRPAGSAAVQQANVEVLPSSNLGIIQRWTTTPNANIASVTVQRHRDSVGAWSQWATPVAGDGLTAGAGDQYVATGALALIAGLTDSAGQPWAWTGPAGVKLTVPTHEGSGQATHPSVVHVPAGWNGYSWWMAHTPYPNAVEAHEDPNVVASNDGTTWVVPTGLANPLDDQPGTPGPHNSDTHLMLHNGMMVMTWRTVDRPNGNRNIIYARTSMDGVAWTPKQLVYTAPASGALSSFVSQSLLRVGGKWRLYGFDVTVSPTALKYMEATTAGVPTSADWGAPVTCTVSGVNSGRRLWHGEVQLVGGAWWGLFSDAAAGGTVDGALYLARSADGLTWSMSPIPVTPKFADGHDAVYKSAMVVYADRLDIIYSGYRGGNKDWYLYRTSARPINPLGGMGVDATAAFNAYVAAMA